LTRQRPVTRSFITNYFSVERLLHVDGSASTILCSESERVKQIGEDWNHSHQTKEQVEAVLTMKQEAASRKQRALAYAFSHQALITGHPCPFQQLCC
jgi:hypothetical protein